MYSTGTLLKTDNPAIYIVDNNEIRHITNLASYISFGFQEKDYRKISEQELSRLNPGKPIGDWGDLSPDLKLYIKEHLWREKLAVDIIIVNYNSLPHLKKCLHSIYTNTDYPYNIIIIDNNSTDKSREFLARLNNITVVYNQKNRGCAAAWNQGIKKGSNNFIVLLNPDTEVTIDWLYPLVKTAAANQDIALIGTKHVNENEAVIHAGVIKKNNEFIIRKHPRDNPDVYNEPGDVARIHGACFMIKRELIPKLGYFDERYFLYSEETDYCLNAQNKGYRIYYYPVKIYHYEKGASIDQQKRQKIRLESIDKFKKKWGTK
ncbi:glycosyltransferase [Iocasia frigidifontis]|uniref:Glycosyltransferase n=1 Tax=Iocasia fonsfrigidae TaxID=2682810 RepID=A0A8A7KIP4_9FIRM|nr:glycosyltransferase family 2 protein [Iocasia fonsfrigidae]QTL99459.1 glycosyltransferase [Iocasia fonsfrigidae]